MLKVCAKVYIAESWNLLPGVWKLSPEKSSKQSHGRLKPHGPTEDKFHAYTGGSF